MSAASRWGTPVSLIRLEGSDTRRFLHGQSSQAIELAKPGDCLPTCLISPRHECAAWPWSALMTQVLT